MHSYSRDLPSGGQDGGPGGQDGDPRMLAHSHRFLIFLWKVKIDLSLALMIKLRN